MHERTVQQLQSDWDWEAESFGRTDGCVSSRSLYPLSGDYGSRPKNSKLFTNLKNMQNILPYNMKKGTKGDTNLTWLESWNSEQYGHIIVFTVEHKRKTIALPKYKIANFYVQFSYLYQY